MILYQKISLHEVDLHLLLKVSDCNLNKTQVTPPVHLRAVVWSQSLCAKRIIQINTILLTTKIKCRNKTEIYWTSNMLTNVTSMLISTTFMLIYTFIT